MAKKTAKYVSACTTATQKAGLMASDIRKMSNQDELYATLNKAGFHWDSGSKEWQFHAPEAADDPTPLVMIRVWADAEIVEEAADEVIEHLKRFRLVERSRPYPCRPPKQFESRVYLKFLPEAKS